MRGVAIIAFPVAVAGLLIVMVAEPWESDGSSVSAIEHRVCDLSVFVPKSAEYEDDAVQVYPLFVPAGRPTGAYLMIETRNSWVAIDAITGNVGLESVAPEEEALLEPILDSMTVSASESDEAACLEGRQASRDASR